MLKLLSALTGLLLATQAIAAPHPVDGSWQLVRGEYLEADGRMVNYETKKLQSIKVITDGHFSFTTLADGRFWSAGAGTYVADATTYTERPSLASYKLTPEGSYTFRYRIENDVWTL